MNYRFLKTFLLLFLLTNVSCQNSPYDTSTPEKFVTSLGLIGAQPKDHNPLPYFYDEEAATAILLFDETAEKTLNAFDTFRDAVAKNFPAYVKTNESGRLKVRLEKSEDLNTRNFTFSASMIGAQMKERSPADYEFVSVSTSEESGITELKQKIMGNVSTIPMKKTNDGYRMFFKEGAFENIQKSVAKTKKLQEVFLSGIEQINNGDITTDNFKQKMEALSGAYFKALR